jgi:ribosomal protein S6
MSTTEDRKEKTVYELGYLLLPSIAEDKLSDVVNTIKGIVSKAGGEEIASEDPIHFDLAYTMSKTVGARKYVVDQAYIGWVKFECEPSCAPEINDAMKKLEEVLRHLLVKAPRETHFTFAEALRKLEEAEAARQAAEVAAQAAAQAPVEAAAEKVVE